MTTAQISDFILEKDYTNFLTLQQVINELTDAGMVEAQTVRNRTHLSITEEGKETLNFFPTGSATPSRQISIPT